MAMEFSEQTQKRLLFKKVGYFLNLKNRVADEAIPLMRRGSGDEQQQKVMKR
jgi:hypothetical protein